MSRELDAEIAVKLFGWEWLERETSISGQPSVLKALFPPEHSKVWKRISFDAKQWQPAKSETLRFIDWDKQALSEATAERRREYWGLPHFSDDFDSVQEVIEKMLELGFRWNASAATVDGKKLYLVDFSMPDPPRNSLVQEDPFLSDSLPTAICEAALRKLS